MSSISPLNSITRGEIGGALEDAKWTMMDLEQWLFREQRGAIQQEQWGQVALLERLMDIRDHMAETTFAAYGGLIGYLEFEQSFEHLDLMQGRLQRAFYQPDLSPPMVAYSDIQRSFE